MSPPAYMSLTSPAKIDAGFAGVNYASATAGIWRDSVSGHLHMHACVFEFTCIFFSNAYTFIVVYLSSVILCLTSIGRVLFQEYVSTK